jgi:hypothetical protein
MIWYMWVKMNRAAHAVVLCIICSCHCCMHGLLGACRLLQQVHILPPCPHLHVHVMSNDLTIPISVQPQLRILHCILLHYLCNLSMLQSFYIL